MVMGVSSSDRLEVEVRLDSGKQETKSIKGANLRPVKTDAGAWREGEIRHRADKRRREEEDRKRREEEAKHDALKQRMKASGLPEMELSECVEAEMSGLPLDEPTMTLLRRLKPEKALDILQPVSSGRISDVATFVRLKAKTLLGEDSEDEASDREHQALASSSAPQAQVPAQQEEPDSEDDFELLPKDGPPWLPLPESIEAEPTEEQMDVLHRAKQEAVEAVEAGDLELGLKKYTEAILTGGGATALMLSKRAELLLKLKRPCAAIRDCTDALEFNPDCGKAYRVRGLAHRRLANWQEAQRDLSNGQNMDYDEDTVQVQRFVTDKLKRLELKASRKRAGLGEPPPKVRKVSEDQ